MPFPIHFESKLKFRKNIIPQNCIFAHKCQKYFLSCQLPIKIFVPKSQLSNLIFKKKKNYIWISFLICINVANRCLTITLKSRLDISSRIFETNIFLFIAGNSKIHFWHFGQKYNFGENFAF